MDLRWLLTLQGRSRRNAQRSTRKLQRERADADEAGRAVAAVHAPAVSPDPLDSER